MLGPSAPTLPHMVHQEQESCPQTVRKSEIKKAVERGGGGGGGGGGGLLPG